MALPGVPPLILRDLSEYAALSFTAAFDVPSPSAKPQKRVSYITLSKKTTPQLADLFLRFKTNPEIYINGTLEAILSVSRASPLHNHRLNAFREAYYIPIIETWILIPFRKEATFRELGLLTPPDVDQ